VEQLKVRLSGLGEADVERVLSGSASALYLPQDTAA
jgi:hypothetical protein